MRQGRARGEDSAPPGSALPAPGLPLCRTAALPRLPRLPRVARWRDFCARGECHCRMLESVPPVTNLCREIHASAATGPSCSRAHERWPAPCCDASTPTGRERPGSGRSPTNIEPSSKVAATCSPDGLMATASAISPPSLTMPAAHLWDFVGPSATERTAMWLPRYAGASRVKAPDSQSDVGGWRDLHVALIKVR